MNPPRADCAPPKYQRLCEVKMRAVFFGLLVYSWVGVVREQLASPSMLHHGPLLTQVVLDGWHRSDVYRLYSATYATAWTREYCVVASSASAHGFGLNVLGEGRQAHFDQDRFLDKLWALRAFVVEVWNTTPEDMRNSTLILFFDGYDVLVNGKPRTLVKRFVHSKKKILFGAEKGCCGTRDEMAFSNNQCDPMWPTDKYTTTPFLNSGVFLGFVTEVDHLLTAAKNEYDSYIAKLQSDYGPIQPYGTRTTRKGPWDPYLAGGDQQLICQLFAHEVVDGGQSLRSAIGMSLDYESLIFLNAYQMEIGREIVITANGRVRYDANLDDCDNWDQARLRDECRQHSVRGLRRATMPVILHFNGRQKENMMAVASQMQWPFVDPEAVWESEIYSVSSGARTVLKEACALYMPGLPLPAT